MTSTQTFAPGVSRRVLVAEDSGVTQDLLRLLLSERGYAVDTASDGASALDWLRRRAYDIVLMDFHMPKMDGLEVAAAYRAETEGPQPRFIAITGDTKGMLAHAGNCETFDRIVPKPFDVDDICRIIETVEAQSVVAARAPAGRPVPPEPQPKRARTTPAGEGNVKAAAKPAQTARPAATGNGQGASHGTARTSAIFDGLGYKLLRWPQDFVARLSVIDADYDAIAICERTNPRDLAPLWQRPSLHVLPVIDLAGSLGSRCDLDASKLAYGENDAVHRVIQAFRDRRQRLHRDLLLSEDMGEKLMGRMLVSNQALTATYDPSQPGLVRYNITLEDAAVIREADLLHESGFLRRDFLDRMPVCDRCASSRFNVREECPDCSSSNLTEESYLHHFKCAYQGVESDFRRGDALVCPKCRQELSHFSVDYDKPGIMVKCQACGHAASEPQAGFICLDCGAHFVADAMRSRDVFSYALTERAAAFLETGRSLLGHRQRALRFAELPLELIVALNGALKRHEEQGSVFALLDISYQNARLIEREHGARQFDQARDLFLENLRSMLRKSDRVVKGQLYDFALLHDVAPQEARSGVASLKEEAGATLRLDLGVAIDVFGPEDFA